MTTSKEQEDILQRVWMFSDNEEDWSSYGAEVFLRRQDAITAAREELDLSPGDHFWTGCRKIPDLGIWANPFNADQVLEHVEEKFGDNYPGLVPAGWPDAPDLSKRLLEQRLWETLIAWLKEQDQWPPPWYLVNQMQIHTAP